MKRHLAELERDPAHRGTMTGDVVSLNVGGPTPVPYRGNLVSTGIFKAAVEGPVLLTKDGFVGDHQADRSVHGGEHKAAYLYSADNYDWWATELAHPLERGEFGENLTVTGFADGDVSVGDTLRVGTALVQVTSPREPCFKLGIRMGDHRFPARFREANRLGFYVRVLEEGAVRAGDEIVHVAHASASLTIAEFHQVIVTGRADAVTLQRLLTAPDLEPGWVEWAERRLGELDPPVT